MDMCSFVANVSLVSCISRDMQGDLLISISCIFTELRRTFLLAHLLRYLPGSSRPTLVHVNILYVGTITLIQSVEYCLLDAAYNVILDTSWAVPEFCLAPPTQTHLFLSLFQRLWLCLIEMWRSQWQCTKLFKVIVVSISLFRHTDCCASRRESSILSACGVWTSVHRCTSWADGGRSRRKDGIVNITNSFGVYSIPCHYDSHYLHELLGRDGGLRWALYIVSKRQSHWQLLELVSLIYLKAIFCVTLFKVIALHVLLFLNQEW